MSGKVQAVARVQITVEFAVGGQAWNADAPIEQVHRQAKEAAIQILRSGLAIDGLISAPTNVRTNAEIVGDPKITAILVEAQS